MAEPNTPAAPVPLRIAKLCGDCGAIFVSDCQCDPDWDGEWEE